MRIGILKGVFSKNKDALLLEKAAQRRGHFIEIISLKDAWLEVENGKVRWIDKNGGLDRFNIILVRGGGKMFRLQRNFLSWLARRKVIVVDKKFIKGGNFADKTFDLSLLVEHGFKTPNFYLFSNEGELKNKAQKLGFPFFLKNKREHRGVGVFLINSLEELNEKIKTIEDISDWYLQQKIDFEKDIRVFVIGDEVLGAIERIPPKGEYRANISLGGRAKPFEINYKLKDLSKKAAKLLDCEIAGVDFLLSRDEAYIIEVNSIPQFYGFMRATKIDVPQKIIEYLEKIKIYE